MYLFTNGHAFRLFEINILDFEINSLISLYVQNICSCTYCLSVYFTTLFTFCTYFFIDKCYSCITVILVDLLCCAALLRYHTLSVQCILDCLSHSIRSGWSGLETQHFSTIYFHKSSVKTKTEKLLQSRLEKNEIKSKPITITAYCYCIIA